MRIGYDAKRIVRNGTGLGSYGRTLINSLSAVDTDDAFLLYAPDKGREDLRSQIVLRPNVTFHYPDNAHGGLKRALWRSHGIVKDLLHNKVDLYHGLSGELPPGIHKAGIPTVVTIHDLIFLRHPEYYHWLDVQIYRWKFFQTLKEADHIIAISECTKRDILYYGDYPEEKISVIYQSAARRFTTTNTEEDTTILQGLGNRYILQVGTLEERKNALESMAALEDLPDDIHLVLVGRQTTYTEQILHYARQQGLEPRLHILSGVSNDDLPVLYHHAACFVYPSRYEGFGIPIIEAIQCGLPVVAATGSCLEEAGGPDSLYVSPDDPHALAEAVLTMLNRPDRAEVIARSQEYVRRFENDSVAEEVKEVYRTILKVPCPYRSGSCDYAR